MGWQGTKAKRGTDRRIGFVLLCWLELDERRSPFRYSPLPRGPTSNDMMVFFKLLAQDLSRRLRRSFVGGFCRRSGVPTTTPPDTDFNTSKIFYSSGM